MEPPCTRVQGGVRMALMSRSWNSPPIIASQIGKASWSHTWHGVVMTQRRGRRPCMPSQRSYVQPKLLTLARACVQLRFPHLEGVQGVRKGVARGPVGHPGDPPGVSSPGAHRLYILLLGLGAGDDHGGVDAALGRVVLAGDELGASKGVSLKRRKSARAFLREYSDKRRHLDQLLGQLGDFLTW
jgi:hypothetical protein